MDEDIDQLEQRCPRLGGPVFFAYCKTSGDDHSVCWKIFDCWWEYFDVVKYFKQNLPEDKFEKITHSKPKQKIVSLVELIEKAKKRVS